MSSTSATPYTTTREQAVVEAWSQGFNVGAVVVLVLIFLCNYRKKNLLHKLILGELLLTLCHSFFCFFNEPEYGWILSSTATLLYISYFIHNLVAWLKIKPFLPTWGVRSFIITLLLVQPYWILETWANFQYHNHLGSRIFDTSRLLEPLFRDPWWVFATIKLVLAINENYEFTIPELIRTSPRFGIMLLCLILSITFLITDVVFMIVVSERGGVNPFWRLALIFKCASDVIFLDDFKSVLDRISESAMRKIAAFEYRDNASPSVNQLVSVDFPAPGFQRKSSRFKSSSRAEMDPIMQPRRSKDDDNYEIATDCNQSSTNNSTSPIWQESSELSHHGCESQDDMVPEVNDPTGGENVPAEPAQARTRYK
ncbi:hypothetical protein FHETE_5872 [Fusarium heterosporum]|uniref:Uncharacterized protein n=1 Tax=Fusarium heterosporum TaxID=42747 RepID=A0A8H5TDL4_FUSHE|nr:hypothetical protein FHETE_5872 [Fusarium heterosporum]